MYPLSICPVGGLKWLTAGAPPFPLRSLPPYFIGGIEGGWLFTSLRCNTVIAGLTRNLVQTPEPLF